MIDLAILKKARAAVAAESLYIFSCSSVSKEISLHKMQNGSLQQEFCVCCNYNVKQVILMPTDLLFVWLHIEFNLYFVTIFFLSYICLDTIMSCTMNILFKDIKENLIELK